MAIRNRVASRLGKMVKPSVGSVVGAAAAGAILIGVGKDAKFLAEEYQENVLGDRNALSKVIIENLREPFVNSRLVDRPSRGRPRAEPIPHVLERNVDRYGIEPPDGSMVFGMYNQRLGG